MYKHKDSLEINSNTPVLTRYTSYLIRAKLNNIYGDPIKYRNQRSKDEIKVELKTALAELKEAEKKLYFANKNLESVKKNRRLKEKAINAKNITDSARNKLKLNIEKEVMKAESLTSAAIKQYDPKLARVNNLRKELNDLNPLFIIGDQNIALSDEERLNKEEQDLQREEKIFRNISMNFEKVSRYFTERELIQMVEKVVPTVIKNINVANDAHDISLIQNTISHEIQNTIVKRIEDTEKNYLNPKIFSRDYLQKKLMKPTVEDEKFFNEIKLISKNIETNPSEKLDVLYKRLNEKFSDKANPISSRLQKMLEKSFMGEKNDAMYVKEARKTQNLPKAKGPS
jgi:hypothetical protein